MLPHTVNVAALWLRFLVFVCINRFLSGAPPPHKRFRLTLLLTQPAAPAVGRSVAVLADVEPTSTSNARETRAMNSTVCVDLGLGVFVFGALARWPVYHGGDEGLPPVR